MADIRTDVADPGTPSTPTLSVAEAVALAGKGVRLAAPGSLWVQGEVSGLVKSRAGHWYWSLSGDGVRLPACALRRDATAIGDVLRGAGVVLADGLTVRVFGSLGVYAVRAQVQLQVSAIDPAVSVGVGVLAKREVRARLAAAGLMARQRQLRPPLCPLRVGVVAPAGQGLADFVGVLQASPWGWRVRVVTVASEGPGAPAGIAAAIADLARADLVVVARGGGSGVTAAYDTYEVAAAVCTSAVPVVMAVGHHDDESVADSCAFRSVSTPTAAGEFCCELLRAADAQVAAVGREIVDAGRHRLDTAAREVAAVESAIAAERGRLMAARAHAARLAAARSARRARWALVAAAVLAVIVLFLILAR